jgi:hypothetical protein
VNLLFKRRVSKEVDGQSWAPRWWVVLVVGLVLWIAAVGTAWVTTNLILLPTIVLLGSFLVPVTGVTWYLDHDPSPALSPRRVIAAFIIAGVIGALAASLLDILARAWPRPDRLSQGRVDRRVCKRSGDRSLRIGPSLIYDL